jgi:hypothetical protein
VGCLSSGKHNARSQSTYTHIVPYAMYQCWMAVAAMCAPFHRCRMTSEPSSLTPGIVGARASFRPTARSRAPRRSTENFPTADPCLALEGSIAPMVLTLHKTRQDNMLLTEERDMLVQTTVITT